MPPLVFTYSCTSFKCASHENESFGSGLQSQIKVPPQKKKKNEEEGIGARGLRKNVQPILTLEVDATETLEEEMSTSYDIHGRGMKDLDGLI